MKASPRLPAIVDAPFSRQVAHSRRSDRLGLYLLWRSLSRNDARAAYARAVSLGAHEAPIAIDRIA